VKNLQGHWKWRYSTGHSYLRSVETRAVPVSERFRKAIASSD